MTEWAEDHGHEITKPVEERSVSGNKPWRARELGEIVRRLEAGEADGIIVRGGLQARLRLRGADAG